MARRRIPRWLLSMTLAVGSLSMLTAENGIREDELRCEEAKKHLIDCCGAASVDHLDCTYTPGCDNTDYPDLDAKTAVCLRDASCDALKKSGACEGPQGVACE
jgi:hypothetical protein